MPTANSADAAGVDIAMDWASAVVLAMPEDKAELAFDRSMRRYDADGRLHVETSNISKANICPYFGREIPGWQELGLDADRTYQLYRDPAELEKGAATFNNLPILSRHVPVTAADHKPELVIGSTGSHAAFDGMHLKNSLVFWAADAIGAIEDEERKELSSAYRYRADMTPGEVDGVRFDGVMRDIVGNHVALVSQGRAGPSVVVGDSKPNQEIIMAKTVLTRKAAMVQGALATLKPKLAQDAKVDLTSVLAGVTAKNYKAKKPTIAKAFEGKMAQDADIEDVIELLDQLESIEPAEIVEEATDPVVVDPTDDNTAEDDDGSLLEFLKGKLSDEDYQKACGLIDSPAMDDDQKEDAKDIVTKPAMDAAIKAAVQSATANTIKAQLAIREAERFVRPWVGELAVAQDSAEGVYRVALSTLGVNAEGIHADALKPILEAHPQPGAAPRRTQIAQDAAAEKSYNERFPHANRLK